MNENRSAYVQKLKAKLDEWNAEIDVLEARARQKNAEARQDLEKEIENLKEKRAEARQRMEEMQRAGEGAWQDLKEGAEKASQAFGEALSAAKSRFS